MRARGRIHYAWVILLVAVCIQGGTTGLMTNCTGVLFSAVIEEMGFRNGDLSVFYTIRSLVSAVCCGIVTKIFLKKNPKAVMTIIGLLGGLGFAGMYLYQELWQWYVSGILVGISVSSVLVIVSIVVNNWFAVKRGFVIGIAMAASGLAGAIFSPILSEMILAFGWRYAAAINGVAAFVMVALPSILFLVRSPEDIGMKPYGADHVPAVESQKVKQTVKSERSASIFFLCSISLMLAGAMSQFGNQVAMLAQSLGYSISIGAIATSCIMVGNISGKLLVGMLADKIGVYRAIYFCNTFVALAAFGLQFAEKHVMILYAGTLVLGLVYSMCTTVPPLIFTEVYSVEEYKQYLSRHQSLNPLVLALANSLFPYIYDFTGSFDGALLLGCGFALMSMILFTIIRKKTNGRRTAMA